SAGVAVRYWPLGTATSAPTPIYLFFGPDGEPLTDHPALVDAVPGDPGYSPIHAINKVTLSERYRGERITTNEALADAIDLGLASDPEPDGTFVHTPIVLPDARIEIGDATATPDIVYARGYEVGVFRFGGDLGVQPGSQFVPTLQVSFLRAARGASYDASRPIFEATIPTGPATDDVTYTPLSKVLNVDLAPGVDPAEITDDAQLFVRAANGSILETTSAVARFEITPTLQVLQLQFAEGSL
ncbi:MAG: hypothetical protein H7138_27780, partial [Myxococcales bacterium]|nr:hypothetical protein [Myxococcales bacterium]